MAAGGWLAGKRRDWCSRREEKDDSSHATKNAALIGMSFFGARWSVIGDVPILPRRLASMRSVAVGGATLRTRSNAWSEAAALTTARFLEDEADNFPSR